MPVSTKAFKREKDYTARLSVANRNALEKLADAGLLDEFLAYKEGGKLGGAWNAVKSAGTNILDVLQRGEYAASGVLEETYGGDPGVSEQELKNAAKRVGREVLSGVGNIRGEKRSIPDVVKEQFPAYSDFAENHPVASIGTDLAMSVAGDPTTYIPGAAIAKGLKPIGRVAKSATAPLRGTKAYQNIADVLGRTFDPAYLWKKGGEKLANPKNAKRGYDILYKEGKYADNLRRKYQHKLRPVTEDIAAMEPEQVRDFVREMFLPGSAKDASVLKAAETARGVMKEVGRRDFRYIGKDIDLLLDGYFPNDPKLYTDLMDNAGEHVASGHARGLRDVKQSFERGKVIKDPDKLLAWWKEKGISDENLAEVVTRNLVGRTGKSANRIRQIRTQAKLTRELPDVFREVPLGTTQVWDEVPEKIAKNPKAAENWAVPWATNFEPEEIVERVAGPALKAGESLWMPAGNLRFFAQSKWDALPGDVRRLLEDGGELTDDMWDALQKEGVGVTTRVKAYAVPSEIVEDITRVSKNLANEYKMFGWYDEVLNVFKNTAILSPFFHVRNFVSSSSQNYLADVKPQRYADALDVLTSKDANKIVSGKTVGGWRKLMQDRGIVGGSFVGQQTGKTGIPVAEKVFELNRWVGSHVEDMNRAPLFMDRMLKGQTADEAMNAVKKFHFDYNELTDAEKQIGRRLFPFYSWQRKNIPLQVEMLMRAPKKYRNLVKLKQSIASGNEAEQTPDWWKDQDVWMTKGDYKGQPTGVMVGLPYNDLNVGNMLENPTGSMGPAGTAIGLMTNQNTFYNKPIQEFPGQKEAILQIGEKSLKVNPKIKYAVENLIPIVSRYITDPSEEISKIVEGKADDATKLKLLSRFIGVRLLPVSKDQVERQEIYKLRRELENFSKYTRQQEGTR